MNKINRIWVIISIISVFIAIISVYWAYTHKVKLMDSYIENESLLIMVEQLMKSERRPLRSEMPFILNEEIENLKKKGLNDPVNDLVNDLRNRAEMIPYDGVLGGSMNFYDPRQIYVLNGHWVVAYFEDGHYGGYALLKFEVVDKDSVEWKLMDAYIH